MWCPPWVDFAGMVAILVAAGYGLSRIRRQRVSLWWLVLLLSFNAGIVVTASILWFLGFRP